jgi:23S rRNA (uridine2552-2'-O)-methyltransferase
MSRGGSGGRTRVKTARGRTPQSNRWLERQLNDPYVRKAKAEGYRSRAAYKLLELDERFALLKGVKRVVDLGIAPGGWSQAVRRRVPGAAVVGIDLLPVDPIDGVTIIQGDFMADEAPAQLIEALGGAPDLVLSDMAANTVGHPQTDALRTMALVETAFAFACDVLAPGGTFVAKVFAGGADSALVAAMKSAFTTVKHAKPPPARHARNFLPGRRAGAAEPVRRRGLCPRRPLIEHHAGPARFNAASRPH